MLSPHSRKDVLLVHLETSSFLVFVLVVTGSSLPLGALVRWELVRLEFFSG